MSLKLVFKSFQEEFWIVTNNGLSDWQHYHYGNEKFGSFSPKNTQQPHNHGFDFVANRALAQAGSYVLSNSTRYIDQSNLASKLLNENLILGGGSLVISDLNLCNPEANQACIEYEFQDDILDFKAAKVIFKVNTILKPEEGFKIRASTINVYFGDCEKKISSLRAYEDSVIMNSTFYQYDHLGNTRLAYKIKNNNNLFGRTLTNAIDYYPFGKILREYQIQSEKFKFSGKERDEESGYDYFEARLYDSEFGRFLQVDPLGAERSWLSPFNYAQNNPIMRVDLDGRLDGDYYKNGVWQYNDGINDNKIYEYTRSPSVTNELKGNGNSYQEVGTETSLKMSFTGSANLRNQRQADGQLNVIQSASNGKDYAKASFDAVGGPWGNGSPENGNYLVNNLQDRGPNSSWPNTGMTKEGIGFSLNLIPQFETGRTNLRIHPDGGKWFGTQGCIGLTTGKNGLTEFKEIMQSTLSNQSEIPMKINISNNLNNNGYDKKSESNGE